MEFNVRRASNSDTNINPLNEELSKKYRCHQKTYDYIDRRTWTEEEYNRRFEHTQYGLWKSQGVNHTTWKNGVQRTFPDKMTGWFIEIKSIKQLLEFYKDVKHDILLGDAIGNHSILCLLIVDDYLD